MRAKITTSKGEMIAELYEKETPIAVENFTKLINGYIVFSPTSPEFQLRCVQVYSCAQYETGSTSPLDSILHSSGYISYFSQLMMNSK